MKSQNIIIVLFLLFTVSISKAQQAVGKVTYNATVEPTEEYKKKYQNKKKTKQDRLFDAIEEEGKNFKLELLFSKQYSVYELNEPMHRDSQRQNVFNMAKTIYKAGNKFYNSSKERKITKEIDFLEEKYLIETLYDSASWKMLNKQEKIGNYTCYLAERDYEYESRKGKVTVKQTVWYTPEIPFSFGPAEFVGFPGLVLKVKSGTIVYNAKKIQLNIKEKVDLKLPKEGKKISEEEFKKIAKKARKSLMGN